MEAHIRKCILKRTDKLSMFERALIAKDIAICMVMFTDWLWSEDSPFIPGDECWTKVSEPGKERFTLNEVFNYWLNKTS